MVISDTRLAGVKEIILTPLEDLRGSFTKIYHQGLYHDAGIDFSLKEQYISVSRKNVIRGMHFQTPPHACDKIVTVLSGRALDVILDVRPSSPTYGKFIQIGLCPETPKAVFIPKGCAHGFLALEDNTCMLYNVSAEYSPECDTGIRWDSFGFQWPVGTGEPIISKRDAALEPLKAFQLPSVW